jgi:hypothetical protein
MICIALCVARLTHTSSTASRMHTFYEPLPGLADTAEDVLQMGSWSEVWKDAGWSTRMLTLSDARRHPQFQAVDNRLTRLIAAGTRLGNNVAYEKMCYFRYLAMAAAGGGWMSDYDTIPLGDMIAGTPLPRLFTSYTKHVPSLMVGSADQWIELLMHMLAIVEDVAYNYKNDWTDRCGTNCGPTVGKSDMVALLMLASANHTRYRSLNHVERFLTEERLGIHTTKDRTRMVDPANASLSVKFCADANAKKAAHLSHYAMRLAFVNVPKDHSDKLNRGKWMEMAYFNWQARCSPNAEYAKEKVRSTGTMLKLRGPTCNSATQKPCWE